MIFVDVRLDHPLLREAVRRVPEMTVDFERDDGSERDRHLLFWASGGDFDTFEAAIDADPTAAVSQATPVGDRVLYRCRITGDDASTALYPIIVDTGTVIDSATITADGWRCSLGFPDRGAVDRFFDTCREHAIDFEIDRVMTRRDDPTVAGGEDIGLTGKQREALVWANELGYFDVPRAIDLGALGDELGISDAAASQRIRRGMSTLIDDCVEPPTQREPLPVR